MIILAKLAAGFVLLLVGGDGLVAGAVNLARRMGVSPLMIGIALIGFGTSLPELITSLEAAGRGAPDIAIGNVVGSNIANILLILGFAIVFAPIAIHPQAFKRDGPVLFIATALCVAVMFSGVVNAWTGAAFVVLLLIYIALAYRMEKRQPTSAATDMHEDEAELYEDVDMSLLKALAWTVGGIALTVLGAKFLVSGAVDLARLAGISEAVIGLTVVALGTSLPELAAAIAAGRKGEGDVVLGNVIGSNIYNIFAILGITALVKPLPVAPQILGLDVWVMSAATLAMLFFAITSKHLGRKQGIVLLIGYAAYIGYLARLTL